MATAITPQSTPPSVTKYKAAIWTLLILAPVIAEVLSGSTRLSVLFVLIPEVMVWGVGALFCRELVRRWHAGWPSLLLLGFALAIAEEFLIQQTSIAPLPFPGANAAYGRWFGVNWVYFLFMLGFESLWVVLIPVKGTELLFPTRAQSPWLRRIGAIVCGFAFLLGSRGAWYGWVKVARPRLGAAPYTPPIALLAIGALAIAALIALAWLLRGIGRPSSNHAILRPWIVGFAAAVASAAWYFLFGQIFQPQPRLSAAQAIAGELILAALALLLFSRWTASRQWSAVHAWAACFGGVLGTSAITSYSMAGYTLPDFLFKNVADLLALAALAWLGLKTAKRAE